MALGAGRSWTRGLSVPHWYSSAVNFGSASVVGSYRYVMEWTYL